MSSPKATNGNLPGPAEQIRSTTTITIARIAQMVSQSTARLFGKRYNLKNADFQILLNLPDQGKVTIGELSRRTRLDKAWISRSLGPLIARGLIHISTDPDRPRAKMIGLAQPGAEILAEIAPAALSNSSRYMEGVDARAADAILARILENAVNIEEGDMAAERSTDQPKRRSRIGAR